MGRNPLRIADFGLPFDKLRAPSMVEGRIRHVMPANPHNRSYLETKAERSGHLLDPTAGIKAQERGLSLPA